MKNKKEKDEEEKRGPEGRGVGCSFLLCRSAGSECLLPPYFQAPDAAATVLCSSPTSGEVNLSTGGIVSKAVHCEPLGDVNGIELQGAEVEVLKRL